MINPPWYIPFKRLLETLGGANTEVNLTEIFPVSSMQRCIENATEYGRTPQFEYSFDENLISWRNLAVDKTAHKILIPESYGTDDYSLEMPSCYKMAYLGGDWDDSWNDSVSTIWAHRYARDLIYAPHRGADTKGFGG
jgi:hypothetical protein